MKFRILAFITLFIISTSASFAFYNDVYQSNPHYKDIKFLEEKGLLPKYADNQFHPDNLVKIPDLYELILGYSQTELSKKSSGEVEKTGLSLEKQKYLQTALEKNLITDKSLDKIQQALPKHQIIYEIFQSMGIGVSKLNKTDTFPFIDLDPKSPIANLAQKSYEVGIREEQSNKFIMAKRITRAELTTYLKNLYDYQHLGPTVTIHVQGDKQYDQSLNQLVDVWNSLHNDYFYKNKLQDNKLVNSAIKGLTQEASSESEDPYTVYQEPSEATSFLDSLSNEYEGIGMSVDLINEQVTIVSPFKDSPAEKAGLMPNDIIIKVNDKSTKGLNTQAVVNMIKGPSGTSVKISVLRDGKEMSFQVKRAIINYKSVEYKILQSNDKNIAQIIVRNFGEETANDFSQAVKEVIAQKIDGIIIDLRNNPGGYLDAAIDMISTFTKEAKVAVQLQFSDSSVHQYFTNKNGILANTKTVILINGGSASASEILAGALKDMKKATLIGEQSFGKGTVQTLDGYQDGGIFKYTIAKWLTPNGTSIQKIGITPDIEVKMDENSKEDTQLNKALEQF